MRGVEVPHEAPPQLLGELHAGQPRHVLDPTRASLGEAVHLKEPAVSLVHEQDQEERQDPAQDADVRLLEELCLVGDVVEYVRAYAYPDVDGEREPDEEVGGYLTQARAQPERRMRQKGSSACR